MKTRSLLFGAATVLIADAFALIHSARNRIGTADAIITLTRHEVNYNYSRRSDDDSGVTLFLSFANTYGLAENSWLDRRKLEQLGFDCSVKPDNPTASQFYRRQRSRPVFVAAEYNGPAWQALYDDFERKRAARRVKGETSFPEYGSAESHLVAIDADLDASALRKRHPDGTLVLVVPALVSIYPDEKTGLKGNIGLLSPSIHVPRPFSEQFRSLKTPLPPYKVQLHFGSLHEPWVTAVEIP